MNCDKKIHFNGVYYLESQNPMMNPIAIRPELTPPNYIAWEDTSNGRILSFANILINGQEFQTEIKDIPTHITIIDLNGETYSLVKLTLAIFNDRLRKTVAGSEELNFQSDQEIQEYYLHTNFHTLR